MHRAMLAAAAAALTAAMLSGCGEDGLNTGDVTNDIDAYCAAIKDAQAEFDNLDQFDFAQFGDLRDTISDIADKAPESVESEWRTLDQSFGRLVDAFDNLGIDAADLNDPSALQNLDPAKVRELQQLATELQSEEIQQATQAINKEVKADCGINLQK